MGIVSSMSACIRLVRREVPQANGATMYSTGKGDASYNCIAETGQTGVTSQQEYFNCFIDKTKSYGVDPEDEFGPFGSRCNYFVYGSSPSTANIEKVQFYTNWYRNVAFVACIQLIVFTLFNNLIENKPSIEF